MLGSTAIYYETGSAGEFGGHSFSLSSIATRRNIQKRRNERDLIEFAYY
ncbi:hypothetical protein [Arcticibacter pallidicorallinus]|nr:hypothetical protein [Arcticibacter pallidicorallinus]